MVTTIMVAFLLFHVLIMFDDVYRCIVQVHRLVWSLILKVAVHYYAQLTDRHIGPVRHRFYSRLC